MAIKKYKPTSPARRFMSVSAFEEITAKSPEKSLLGTVKKNGGRNNVGRLTVRHQGGGNTRKYRIIDFKRAKDGIPARVASIEYDPNRSANIALLGYKDGENRNILAPYGLNVNDTIYSGADVDITKVSVDFRSRAGELAVCRNGSGIPFSEEEAKKILSEKEIEILIGLDDGSGKATAWGCDLTYEYVKINGDYRT